jgi:hypothetical protein
VLDSVIKSGRPAAAPSVFQPVPKSQLASIEQLPFLRQRFGYAVAQVGAAAALSQKYPAGWGAATQKSVVCRPQQGGYRCPWSYQLNGAHHSGYILVTVTANNYRLGQVAEVGQAAPAGPASGLSPLWYIPDRRGGGHRSRRRRSSSQATPGNGYCAVTVPSTKATGLSATVRSVSQRRVTQPGRSTASARSAA